MKPLYHASCYMLSELHARSAIKALMIMLCCLSFKATLPWQLHDELHSIAGIFVFDITFTAGVYSSQHCEMSHHQHEYPTTFT